MPFPYYELPEFPWPENLKIKFSSIGLPPAATVQEYVEEYAAKFKLLQSITFSSKVTQIDRLPGEPQIFFKPAAPRLACHCCMPAASLHAFKHILANA